MRRMMMSTMKPVLLFSAASLVMLAVMQIDPLSAQGRDRDDRGHGRWGSGPLPQAGVCFFTDTNFEGQHFCIGARDELSELPRGTNDGISSLRVIGNVEVT